MPTYCYSTDDGVVFEREFPMGKAPGHIMVQVCDTSLYVHLDPDGPEPQYHEVKAFRDYRAEGVTGTVRSSENPRRGAMWPMPPCAGSGVHASQGKELSEFLGKRGCPTEVVDGDPIYTSPAHQRKALKLRDMINKSSYY